MFMIHIKIGFMNLILFEVKANLVYKNNMSYIFNKYEIGLLKPCQ